MALIQTWFYVIATVGIAVLANSVSAIWAKGDSKFSLWLILLLIISPLVFITFGLLTSRIGVALGSGTVDSLLTVTTIIVGLVFFNEWHKLSIYQWVGLVLIVVAITLMQFSGQEA